MSTCEYYLKYIYKINFQKKAKNTYKSRIIYEGIFEKKKSGGKCMKKIYGLIRKLGAKYKGYFFTADAIRMTMTYQEKPLRITKDIYPNLAKKYKSTPTNVEHDIRTLVNVCWEGNRKFLEEIAGYSLNYKPTNSEFIDMLAYYLLEMEESESA